MVFIYVVIDASNMEIGDIMDVEFLNWARQVRFMLRLCYSKLTCLRTEDLSYFEDPQRRTDSEKFRPLYDYLKSTGTKNNH